MQTLCSYTFNTIATAAVNPHMFVYWFTNAFIKTPLIVVCGMKTKNECFHLQGREELAKSFSV
jgi:hypothetical protein